ncbi:MAG: hypothetical protein V1847_04970 [Candidatus Diapherotrites archaeon]
MFQKRPLHNRGQTSFETILMVAFVMIVTTVILSYYWQTEPSTKVLISAREHTLQELSKLDSYYVIQKVDVSLSGGVFNVVLGFEPNIDCEDTDASTLFCKNIVGVWDNKNDSAVEKAVQAETGAANVLIQTIPFTAT